MAGAAPLGIDRCNRQEGGVSLARKRRYAVHRGAREVKPFARSFHTEALDDGARGCAKPYV